MQQTVLKTLFSSTTRVDRMILLWAGLCFAAGGIFLVINHLFFHFTIIPLIGYAIDAHIIIVDIFAVLLCLTMFFYGLHARHTSPKAAIFLWGFSAIVIAYYANITLTTGVQATPFAPIDATLANIDSWLGINTPALMAWTHAHPLIRKLLMYAYDALDFEMLLIPFLLACFAQRRALSGFLVAQLSTFFIGALIYYFLPTMAPSGVFHSPYFSHSEHDTSMRFYDVHHFIKVTTAKGGLIAFPSFHVIWAVLILYALRSYRWLLYPAIPINICIMISTVLLGWHYFTDVISGIIIASIGIWFAEWCLLDNLQRRSA